MKTQKIDTVDDLFRIELKESMKIIKLQKYANSKWLIPHFVKDNELPSIFWDLYCKGAPYTEINGEEQKL